MIGVTVLGSTGSIGLSTLNVLAQHPDQYQVVALTANTDVTSILEQCLQFKPKYAVMANPDAAGHLQKQLATLAPDITVLDGIAGLEKVASLPEAEYVMAAIVGSACLLPALAAARSGKRVLLANKEALVMSGPLFMNEIRKHNAQLLPIDSEHNAIFQCMPDNYQQGLKQVGVKGILLTASGGPFRTTAHADLTDVTPEQACAHPNWSMGRKISVDSASMMNKGLELIEACYLFDTPPSMIEVVIHPQSIIHSMVQYDDGSVLAQLGCADMRIPIAHALAWPERMVSGANHLDLFSIARLDFEKPDFSRFPCLRLAFEAAQRGGTAPAILNAANEIAVEAFLQEKIRFTDIPVIVEQTLSLSTIKTADELNTILEEDKATRELATELVFKQIGKISA